MVDFLFFYPARLPDQAAGSSLPFPFIFTFLPFGSLTLTKVAVMVRACVLFARFAFFL